MVLGGFGFGWWFVLGAIMLFPVLFGLVVGGFWCVGEFWFE